MPSAPRPAGAAPPSHARAAAPAGAAPPQPLTPSRTATASSAGDARPRPVTPSKDGHGEQLPPASAVATAQVGFHPRWAGAARHGRKPLMIAPCRAGEGADRAVIVACLCNCKEGLLQQCQKTRDARDLLFCLLRSLAVSAA